MIWNSLGYEDDKKNWINYYIIQSEIALCFIYRHSATIRRAERAKSVEIV